MRSNTLQKYEQTCRILRLNSESRTWEEYGEILPVHSRPLDRLGMILVLMDDYYAENQYRFYNFRNKRGTVLYPFPNQDTGSIFQTFDVSVRMDPYSIVQNYSYVMRRVDEETQLQSED